MPQCIGKSRLKEYVVKPSRGSLKLVAGSILPTTGTRKARKAQAVVVEPPMIAFLEDAIEDH